MSSLDILRDSIRDAIQIFEDSQEDGVTIDDLQQLMAQVSGIESDLSELESSIDDLRNKVAPF